MAGVLDNTDAAEAADEEKTARALRRRAGWNVNGADGDMFDEVVCSYDRRGEEATVTSWNCTIRKRVPIG